MTARIVVTRHQPRPALDLLASAGELWLTEEDRQLSPAELHEAARGAAILVTSPADRVDAALLDAAGPSLLAVTQVAVGVDNVDLEACAARGVIVTNTPGVLAGATADLTFGLILAVARRLAEGDRMLRAGEPWHWSPTFMLGAEVHGSTIGIVGFGGIGREVARRARAFGMRVLYTGRRDAPPAIEAELAARRVPLEALLAEADFVCLHVPLTAETHHLIDAAALARMKSTAYLINAARGPVVDEQALVEALRDGVVAGAGLDVFEREPDVHPGLLDLPNVVLVPHLGSATGTTRTAMAVLAAENALALLAGDAPPTPVQPAGRVAT